MELFEKNLYLLKTNWDFMKKNVHLKKNLNISITKFEPFIEKNANVKRIRDILGKIYIDFEETIWIFGNKVTIRSKMGLDRDKYDFWGKNRNSPQKGESFKEKIRLFEEKLELFLPLYLKSTILTVLEKLVTILITS